jgi:hypothetical protein
MIVFEPKPCLIALLCEQNGSKRNLHVKKGEYGHGYEDLFRRSEGGPYIRVRLFMLSILFRLIGAHGGRSKVGGVPPRKSAEGLKTTVFWVLKKLNFCICKFSIPLEFWSLVLASRPGFRDRGALGHNLVGGPYSKFILLFLAGK